MSPKLIHREPSPAVWFAEKVEEIGYLIYGIDLFVVLCVIVAQNA